MQKQTYQPNTWFNQNMRMVNDYSQKFSLTQTFSSPCTTLEKTIWWSNSWLKQNEKHTKEMWKLQHNFETMDNNNNDFYMVKFDQVADKENTISNGP